MLQCSCEGTLGAFAKLRKTTISFANSVRLSVCLSVCPPVRPSVRMEQLGSHWETGILI
jgi:hypothetical protein